MHILAFSGMDFTTTPLPPSKLVKRPKRPPIKSCNQFLDLIRMRWILEKNWEKFQNQNANKNTVVSIITIHDENQSEIIIMLIGNVINVKCNSLLTTQFIESKNWKLFCWNSFYSSDLLLFLFNSFISYFIFIFVTISIISVYFDGNMYIHKMSQPFTFDSICIFGSIDLKWNGDYWRKQIGKQSDKNELKKKPTTTTVQWNKVQFIRKIITRDLLVDVLSVFCLMVFLFSISPRLHHTSHSMKGKKSNKKRKKGQIKCPLPFQMNYLVR